MYTMTKASVYRVRWAALGTTMALLGGCDQGQKARTQCSPTSIEACSLSAGYANPYEGRLELLSWTQTLRKASLELAGRLPQAIELQVTEDLEQAGLEASLAALMREPAFLGRVKEIYNDLFLTDKYLGDDNALALLTDDDYPNLHWYKDFADSSGNRVRTNDSVAQEPLELIAYVVRNELPFTEIVTANYTVANAYSARSMIGLKGIPLPAGESPSEFRPIRVGGLPHAGVLTSAMFLNRHPTSDTNRNRHRARVVFDFFLASDVEALADRPIDANGSSVENPTLNDPTCTTCHSVLDPMSGTFANFDETGRYKKEVKWYGDMREPGFAGLPLPKSERANALQWLGKRLAAQPRFATAAVRVAFEGLTGQTLLSVAKLGDSADPLYDFRRRAYDVQQWFLTEIEQRFVESRYNFKVLVREIILTPYFRAAAAAADLSPEESAELGSFGTARLLSPEQLSRKIVAVTGRGWKRRYTDIDLLMRDYRLFYGGIDSDLVIKRIVEPNGVMTSMAQRMANEMACAIIPADLSRPSSKRLLFPDYERGSLQLGAGDLPSQESLNIIRSTAVRLHSQILGEELAIGDSELEATAELFVKVWTTGQKAVRDKRFAHQIAEPCRIWRSPDDDSELPEDRQVVRDDDYTVRAWMAVASYLMSDYRFLYE